MVHVGEIYSTMKCKGPGLIHRGTGSGNKKGPIDQRIDED